MVLGLLANNKGVVGDLKDILCLLCYSDYQPGCLTGYLMSC
jgi:hypothetical protein